MTIDMVAAIFVMVLLALTAASFLVIEMDANEYELIVADDGNVWLHNRFENWYELVEYKG